MKSALVIIDFADKSQIMSVRLENNQPFSKKEMTQLLKNTFGDVRITYINGRNKKSI